MTMDPYEERLAELNSRIDDMANRMALVAGEISAKITEAHQVTADLNRAVKDAKDAMREGAETEAKKLLRRKLSQMIESL